MTLVDDAFHAPSTDPIANAVTNGLRSRSADGALRNSFEILSRSGPRLRSAGHFGFHPRLSRTIHKSYILHTASNSLTLFPSHLYMRKGL